MGGGALFLALLPYYNQLSVSVMIGLPAVALAVAAFTSIALWRRTKRSAWLMLSALLFGLSVMTKLFTVFLVPGVLLLVLADGALDKPLRSRIGPALAWLGLSGVVMAGIALWIGVPQLAQLFVEHTLAAGAPTYLERAAQANINSYLRPAWGVLLLAAGGAAIAAVRRRWAGIGLALWSLLGYLFLSLTVPVWYHHQLIVTVPAAMLASVFGGEAVVAVRRRFDDRPTATGPRLAAAVAVAAVAVVLGTRLSVVIGGFRLGWPNLRQGEQLHDRDSEVLAVMWDYAAETDTVISDRPIFPFRLGKPVPPSLALFSEKRLVTGELSESEVIAAIDDVRPAQVLLARFTLPQVEDHLRRGYNLVYQASAYRLYIRNDVAAATRAPVGPDWEG